MKDNSKD
jgi:DNA replication licensing factor MCM2